MKLLVLGASGGTGKLVVSEALNRAHTVTALMRSPTASAPAAVGLSVVEGDPRDVETVTRAAEGNKVIVSALGPRSRHDDRLMPDCMKSMTSAARRVGVQRIILVSAGLLFPNLGMAGAFFRWLTRGAMRGAAEAEDILVRSGGEWTIVRPVRLTNGLASRKCRATNGTLPTAPKPIARADVAAFLVEEAERAMYRRLIVGLCQ